MRNDEKISLITDRIVRRLEGNTAGKKPLSRPVETGHGVFADVRSAVAAAMQAQNELSSGGLALREKTVEAIRQCSHRNAEAFSISAVEESGMGRVEDKIRKNILSGHSTPGVEDIRPNVFTGDKGLTLVERAPWGLIGAIIPCTNSTETIINNSIGMLAAGNSVIFSPHPITGETSKFCVQEINRAMLAAGCPQNLVVTVQNPSIETAQEIMRNEDIRLLVVTGGTAVVNMAMKLGKKVIAAGPGNPPAIVDETANLSNAARDLVAGHSFDNNIICICEKELIVVDSIYNKFKEELLKQPVMALNKNQTQRLTDKVLEIQGNKKEEGRPSREFVGRNASFLLKSIGLNGCDKLRTLLAEVDKDHPLAWTEQLMPVLPMIKAKNFEEALELGLAYEKNNRHTATMFSMNIDRLSRAALAFNCSLFVKNGPSYAGLGFGGEGFASFTIATPTGEGLTSARNFTRERRCALVNYFRIV